MVTTAASPADTRYRTAPGEGYDGVVRLSHAGLLGTGSLLFDGRAILTAAHLFKERSGSTTVFFETPAGNTSVAVTKTLIHPDYDPVHNNHDLALLWLASSAPVQANRYTLYRNSDELAKAFTMVGYGMTGQGETGAQASTTSHQRIKANNVFDADIGTLKSSLGAIMGWSPLPGTQLVADFDNGTSANDALGRLIDRAGLGQGLQEGMIAPGDSGGPGFVAGQLAAVASYTSSLSRGSIQPDIDNEANSSFGEIGSWQRVSAYQSWIDQSLRAQYPNAPKQPDEVKKQIPEGHNGTSYAYFLLQFTGLRSSPEQVLSVDYATRDGTAKAGSDYLATRGTLKLYPGETQAVVAVEVLGDSIPEPHEHFYLDVFNPVGGSFGPDVVQLTAMRTLLDDDGWYV